MKRKVRNLIRLLAIGLFIAGGMTVGLEMLGRRLNNAEVRASYLLLGVILQFLGIILFFASDKLVKQFMDNFDED